MFKNLRTQLMLSGIGALCVLLVSVWLLTRGHIIGAVVMIVIACIYIIALNVWFAYFVADPIVDLTSAARRIASGSYGTRIEKRYNNEIGQLTEEINDMSAKVAIAEKSRTDFISQISHELRTPLTAITGWAETIASDPAVQGDSLRGINIISKESDRLTNMVKELLEFTRIQDGRFNLSIELIDIAAELEDAIFTYGELMRQAGMEINYTPPEKEIPLIPGDSERLKQVFLNLLDNALNHGGEGKRTDVFVSSGTAYVSIVIRDYGHGIPKSELPHVKEKFYKGSSKNRGNGIGLAVCDEIVTRHGGQLKIENAEEEGCRVTILLPLGTKQGGSNVRKQNM